MEIEKGHVVDYVDERGDTHEAEVVGVSIQPPSISDPRGPETTLCTVEYDVGGRTRRAELISDKPNAGGDCYKNPRQLEKSAEEDQDKQDETEPEAPEPEALTSKTPPKEKKPKSS